MQSIIQDFRAYTLYSNPLGVVFFSRGFHALCAYRLGHLISLLPGGSFFAFLLSRIIQILYGIDIHWSARIGGGCRIVHGIGLVIGCDVIIGENSSLYNGVTIGSKGEGRHEKMPHIGNTVKIYAGAKVLGNITIADGATIGANAVVVTDCKIIGGSYGGIPAKLLTKHG